ncbi:MAG TPA: hypothetical protein VIY69_11950 [Candidatus Acidoferrales bacterium]
MSLSTAARFAAASGVAAVVAVLWVGGYVGRATLKQFLVRLDVKAALQNGALMAATLGIFFMCAEVGFRIYLYHAMTNQLVQLVKQQLSAADGFYQFDPQIGFHYKPDLTVVNGGNFRNEFSTNRFGFIGNDIDRNSFTVKKPEDEYRIAVLGDSFALSAQGYIRWSDLVQDYLNHSPAWRTYVGGRFTRVMNFALDGTGFEQWTRVYRFRASDFSPDLVVVSFIINSVVFPQFVYRGSRLDVSTSDDASIRGFVETNLLSKLPWYGLHSELLDTLGSLFADTRRRLTAAAAYDSYTSVQDRAAGIDGSVSALAELRCLNPNVLVFEDPTLPQMLVRDDTANRYSGPGSDKLIGLETQFIAAAKGRGIAIIPLMKFNSAPSDPQRIAALYNLPIDEHPSDYGVALYAQWVFSYLVNWVGARKVQSAPDKICTAVY